MFARYAMSKRIRNVWLSVVATAVGTTILGGLIFWLDLLRNTDLSDGRSSITTWSPNEELARDCPLRFQNVAREMGITAPHGPAARSRILTEDTGSGLAWGDYDNDGDWDLYIVSLPGANDSRSAPNRLYRNDGDRFTDVTAGAGVADAQGVGMGAWFVDFDADGDQDIYVTNFGPNRLFENLGDGAFRDIAEQTGTADPAWSTGATFGDFDRDGDLDIYVCNYVEYTDVQPTAADGPVSAMNNIPVPFTLNPNSFDATPNRLYRNQGDGTFTDVAEQFGVDNPEGRSLAATFCDLNGDGWLDLYVNNDVSANKLFRNPSFTDSLAESPFEDRSLISGTADTRGSMGLSLGEVGSMDGAADGLPDLFITHWIAQENAFYLSSGDAAEFYLDKTRQFGLAIVSTHSVGWGSVLADFDLDGRIDLAVANGNTLEETRENQLRLKQQPPFVFWNTGERFLDVASVAGPATVASYSARGLAAADFDRDGDVDLAVSVNGGRPLLLRNDTKTENRSVAIRLDGHPAVCFGARVEVVVGDERQVRWWGSDASYLSMHALEMTVGLGAAEHVDRIHVRWADGTESVLNHIIKREVRVQHGQRDNSPATHNVE